ncbi:unnamed protein product [Macrosiphum euphorbiae]|uniref:C2H2-type domain-containing protein n=1 Tax=Macrosiphum euphorbiae TaxID=13131 RepID=A0AAV0Y3A6_9HEMI|nr:unnamed protein product [Macrosiphum euphorbiae]
MCNCDQCPSGFNAKRNLIAHQKKHMGVRFPFTICPSTFSYKTGLNKHTKNIHGIVNVPVRLRPTPATPIITQPAPACSIRSRLRRKYLYQISRPVVSNVVTEDDICMEAMDEFEDTG